jgi:ABC-type nitrate/sulfonate/bicarbonate transport system permease component
MVSSQNFDTAAVFAAILLIGLIGIALMNVGRRIEDYFARWRS